MNKLTKPTPQVEPDVRMDFADEKPDNFSFSEKSFAELLLEWRAKRALERILREDLTEWRRQHYYWRVALPTLVVWRDNGSVVRFGLLERKLGESAQGLDYSELGEEIIEHGTSSLKRLFGVHGDAGVASATFPLGLAGGKWAP